MMCSSGGVALKLVFEEAYPGILDSEAESGDEPIEFEPVKPVSSQPEPECILIED